MGGGGDSGVTTVNTAGKPKNAVQDQISTFVSATPLDVFYKMDVGTSKLFTVGEKWSIVGPQSQVIKHRCFCCSKASVFDSLGMRRDNQLSFSRITHPNLHSLVSALLSKQRTDKLRLQRTEGE